MIMVFSVWLGWLPSTWRASTILIGGIPLALTLDGLRHLILPAVTLSLFNIALLIRLARTGMRETLTMDFIRFARAKGLVERRVIWVHALKNILIPVITVQGVELAQLMTGAIVIEQIFAYPGIGRLALDFHQLSRSAGARRLHDVHRVDFRFDQPVRGYSLRPCRSTCAFRRSQWLIQPIPRHPSCGPRSQWRSR